MTEYALDELMVVEASRHIEDGNIVMVGTGLPMVASLFALKSHAPNMCYVVETGPVAPEPGREALDREAEWPCPSESSNIRPMDPPPGTALRD